LRPRSAALAALVLAGCGGSTPSTTPAAATPVAPANSAPQARVTLVVTPNPIVPTEARGSQASPQLAWQTVLTESAGVAVTVNFLNVTLRDAATGALAEPDGTESLSAADIAAAAGSNSVPASGTLVVPQTLAFANDTSGGRLEIAAQVVDVNGHVFGVSVTASVE
jgi:hypothetical protein